LVYCWVWAGIARLKKLARCLSGWGKKGFLVDLGVIPRKRGMFSSSTESDAQRSPESKEEGLSIALLDDLRDRRALPLLLIMLIRLFF
jgi:hypothetical protein